ncbi:PhzF family phenazine biosynthesis protein [Sulfitobacter sp. S190]|uniref:PhzF family phenazine biosynthesis protein n=1 Tax=Sulfitobacter sp. S190 TaxID=2867022 RepID=UPI0021A304CA|nr:PhzF family phenazine biosynthesis protein [Sulfitobacter sp. S190]UWR22722.1 PhzF family phenazine biosynthesis protein [Sulfitobacter sp. S190]
MQEPVKISSFSDGARGGNPAGVVIADRLPAASEMQKVAADLGFSETAFAARDADGGWTVRYYAPEGEVAFCGHATIALGAQLGRLNGAGTYPLHLRDDFISVRADPAGDGWKAALQSPATWSEELDLTLTQELLQNFGLTDADLDTRLRPALAFAGVRHAVLPLARRETLSQMEYPFEAVKALMHAHDLVTVSLIFFEGPRVIHARNAFASGGVVEDPATGAAAAALGGLLVDRNWDGLQGGGAIDIRQGDDMGMPSRIRVDVTGVPGDSVTVSGAVRWMG